MTAQIILTPDQVEQLAAQVADIIASRISAQPPGEHWPEQMPPKVAANWGTADVQGLRSMKGSAGLAAYFLTQ